MAARGKELSPTDADHNEHDDESTIRSDGGKGKRPLVEPPPAPDRTMSFFVTSSLRVLWYPIWNSHFLRHKIINRDKAALMNWLMLPSQTSNTRERHYSFLKLLTIHGLAKSFETLSHRPGSGPSETPSLRSGEYAVERGQNSRSFYNILKLIELEGILPSAVRSLPARMLSYMLLQYLNMATGEVGEELLGECLRFSGYTDEHGNMDMNVFYEWAWDFRIRETSNAYVAAELLGSFDGGPAGEFFQRLGDGHQSGYTLHTIESAFRALDVYIPPFEANFLLQDRREFYQQILVNNTRRYIPYLLHSAAEDIKLDKWEPLHRLMIFVACYMTRVENSTERESPATPEREPSLE